MENQFHFMVEFKLPNTLTEEFMSLVPMQRMVVDRFLEEGILLSYALSLENSRLWAVFCGESELDVMERIIDLPLSDFMDAEIHLLTVYNDNPIEMPAFSLN